MSSATDFWQEHQVAEAPTSYQDSMDQLLKRQRQFPKLEELMPTDHPGETILDFGCGPGLDTILFLNHGAYHVYYADVSWKGLAATNDRLKFHELRSYGTPLLLGDPLDEPLPQVDYIHCAGVLHHMADPIGALERMRGAAPQARVMVYDGERSQHSQSLVPITEWWTPREFIKLADSVGWETVYKGSYECSAKWRPNCWAACFSLT